MVPDFTVQHREGTEFVVVGQVGGDQEYLYLRQLTIKDSVPPLKSLF